MAMTTTRTRRRATEDDATPAEEETKPRASTRVTRRPRTEEPAEPEDTATDDTATEEEAEEEPAKPRRTRSTVKSEEETGDEDTGYDPELVARGWKASKAARPVTQGDWTNDFRWEDDDQLVKILLNEPWSYNQHWVNREQGKRGFPCITPRKGCPLCAIGNKLTQKYVFPILNLTKEPPVVENLQVGIQLAERLEKLNEDRRDGPLDKAFWRLSASAGAKKNRKSYSILPVKERDLADDWELDPEEILDLIDATDIPTEKEAITWSTKSELQEIAEEAMS